MIVVLMSLLAQIGSGIAAIFMEWREKKIKE